MIHRWKLVFLALSVALLAFGPGTARAADQPNIDVEPGVPDPHGQPDGCHYCHAPPEGDQQVGAPLPVVPTCRGCHPTADMHPVNMVPTDVHPHAGWPLENGQVVCSTCHVEPAHDPQKYANLPKPWHRGGPYPVITDFCYQCHKPTSYTRTDPHHPKASYDVNDPTCSACHSTTPERGAPPAKANLRVQASETCIVCHKGEVHYGNAEHMHATLTDAQRAALPPNMRVSADGKIQCWTCHDVHEGDGPGKVGTSRLAEQIRALDAKTWQAVPSDAIWPGADTAHPAMLALPLQDGKLCTACHGEGPK